MDVPAVWWTTGPTNRDAFKFIDPARAALLPTSPENVKLAVNQNAAWWDKNRRAVTERFNNGLMGGSHAETPTP